MGASVAAPWEDARSLIFLYKWFFMRVGFWILGRTYLFVGNIFIRSDGFWQILTCQKDTLNHGAHYEYNMYTVLSNTYLLKRDITCVRAIFLAILQSSVPYPTRVPKIPDKSQGNYLYFSSSNPTYSVGLSSIKWWQAYLPVPGPSQLAKASLQQATHVIWRYILIHFNVK